MTVKYSATSVLVPYIEVTLHILSLEIEEQSRIDKLAAQTCLEMQVCAVTTARVTGQSDRCSGLNLGALFCQVL